MLYFTVNAIIKRVDCPKCIQPFILGYVQYYVKLNQAGRDKVLELMDDFVQIDKYRQKSKKKP